MKMRVHRYLPVTSVEGPGKRFCLWVQGCSIRCKGCAVPWTWNAEGGTETTVDSIFEKIKQSKIEHQIEGITFLGGEPFDQAEALGKLAKRVKEIGLTVMTFSGYLLEDLQKRPDAKDLLEAADLLIDGPFIQEKLDLSRPWTGSSNQRYHFLTPVYEKLKEKLPSLGNKLEIRIGVDGQVSVNGMATRETLSEVFKKTHFKRVRKKD